MYKEIFWGAVDWFSLPALVVLSLALIRKKFAREFPFFFCYAVASALISGARLLAYGSRHRYFYVYWISDSVSTVLALLATCELAVRRLFPNFQRIRFYRYLFLIGGVIIAVSAALTAASNKTLVLMPIVIRGLHTIDFLRVALLLFFVALMLFMGRRWGRHEFGIAFGLGITAAAWLATLAVFTKSLSSIANVFPIFAYDAACIIWLVTLLRHEKPASTPSAPVAPEVLQQAREWEQTLKQSLTGKKGSA